MKEQKEYYMDKIKGVHSTGSVVTVISYILGAVIRRIEGSEFLVIPTIIIVLLTIVYSFYYLYQSIIHKDAIENPFKNTLEFVIRILINLGLLWLILV